MLQQQVGKNSVGFVHKLQDISVWRRYSREIRHHVALHESTTESMSESGKQDRETNICKLFDICYTGYHFVWRESFYEQVEGMVMWSPLSLVIANLFIEYFGEKVIQTTK